MRMGKFEPEAAALLLTAALLYILPPESISALLLPMAAHELGHLAMIALLGLRVRSLRLEPKGLCLEYVGEPGTMGHILVAVAGPAAGFLYAWAASRLSGYTGQSWLSLTAGLSLLLSCYNLLPALPLDGGRVLLHLSCALLGEGPGRRLTELSGLTLGFGLMGLGVWLLMRGRGAALLLAAVWLLLSQENARGLVKKREIV